MHLDYSALFLEAIFPHLIWFLPALIAVVAFKALLPQLSGWAGETRVGATLKRLFPEVRHDLILPDGRGGLTQIDHLALTPAGLLVVETKTYSGSILGRSNESTWTQAIGRQRHSFQNPLRQNYAHVRALEALAPHGHVIGHVVFAGDARFPKGMPEGVCHASDLARALAPLRKGEMSPSVRGAWDRVLGASRTDRTARKAHLRGLQARYGGVRGARVPALALGLSMLWLIGLWIYHRPTISWPAAKTSMQLQGISHTLAPHAPSEWPFVHPATPARLASPPVSPAPRPERERSRPSQPPEHTAAIEWTAAQASGSDKEECAIAIAAVLVDNTAENRRTRDRVCGAPSTP